MSQPPPPPPQARPPQGWVPQGWVPAWPQARPPQHPRAGWSLGLGIGALAGAVVLVVPIVLAPVAWYLGATALRESERAPERWSAGPARWAVGLGIAGTALLAVVTVALLALAIVLWSLAHGADPYDV